MQIKISVIIPVYNAEKYVKQAVDSALQFKEVYEIILVDDNSPDNALEICQLLAQKHTRVSLYQHPDQGNHGAGPTRNLGIEKATGDFIAFLDADDYYLSNRFDAEKVFFENPEVEGIYGALGVHYYSEKSRKKYYCLFENRLTTIYKRHEPKEIFLGQIYMLGTFGLFSIDTLTIRRTSLQKMDVLFKAHLTLHEDTEFFFRLSYYLNLYSGIIDKAIAVRGVHEDNRITKVDLHEINPAVSKVVLWCEVNKWAQNEDTIPEDVKLHIARMYRSFQIANASSLKKWRMIVKYLIVDYKSIRSGLYNINFKKSLFNIKNIFKWHKTS